MRMLRSAFVALLAGWAAATLSLAQEPKTAEKVQKLRIDSGRSADGAFHLDGRDSWQQLQVTGVTASGQERDLTRSMQFEAVPADIVAIDATGLVTPLKDGQARQPVRGL